IRAPGLRPTGGWQFWDTPVSGSDLAAFAARPVSHWVILDLNSAGITDEALDQIKTPPRLWGLVINKSQITSAGLVALREWSLTTLGLPNNPGIDDAAVEHLVAIPTLKQLDLKGTKVTKDGVEKLAKARPLCKITWDGGTIEPRGALGHGLEF